MATKKWLQFAWRVTMLVSMLVSMTVPADAWGGRPASTGDRVEVAREPVEGRSALRRSVHRSPVRAVVRAAHDWRGVPVYYDPRNPRMAPLRCGVSEMDGATAFLMTAPAFLVSLGGFIWLNREYRRSRLTN